MTTICCLSLSLFIVKYTFCTDLCELGAHSRGSLLQLQTSFISLSNPVTICKALENSGVWITLWKKWPYLLIELYAACLELLYPCWQSDVCDLKMQKYQVIHICTPWFELCSNTPPYKHSLLDYLQNFGETNGLYSVLPHLTNTITLAELSAVVWRHILQPAPLCELASEEEMQGYSLGLPLAICCCIANICCFCTLQSSNPPYRHQ